MKKLAILLIAIIFVLSFVSCQKNVEVEDSINVIFFTANQNATLVPSYLNLTEGQKINPPEDPTRDGYKFIGWYKDYYKTEPWDFDKDVLGAESIVLYADWEPAIFTITYVLNGGTMPEDEYPETFKGGEFGVLPLPTQKGFAFTSWYTYEWKDENGEITTVPGDKGYQKIPDVFEDVTLYAHWEPIVIDVKFNMNFPEENAPSLEVSRIMMNYGDIIDFEIPDNTDKYEFLGWNSKRDGSGDYYVNGDMFERTLRLTLYAVWQEK